MKSAWNTADRRELQERLRTLRPDIAGKWGRLTAPQMVCHLVDALRMADGELTVAPKNLPIRFTPVKELIIYWMPFPKNAPTVRELLTRQPSAWDADVSDLERRLEGLATRAPNSAWPDHPAFGRLRGSQWGVLIYRHMDHHLRQFGV